MFLQIAFFLILLSLPIKKKKEKKNKRQSLVTIPTKKLA